MSGATNEGRIGELTLQTLTGLYISVLILTLRKVAHAPDLDDHASGPRTSRMTTILVARTNSQIQLGRSSTMTQLYRLRGLVQCTTQRYVKRQVEPVLRHPLIGHTYSF